MLKEEQHDSALFKQLIIWKQKDSWFISPNTEMWWEIWEGALNTNTFFLMKKEILQLLQD